MEQVDRSSKKYGIAVALSGIFGIVGIHHFYLENWLHGLFDLGLFIVGFSLLYLSDDPGLVIIGLGLIIVDIIHTVLVIYWLLVGKCKDGRGKLVTYPGQKF